MLLSRRAIGETVERINTSFHTFWDNYLAQQERKRRPVDPHADWPDALAAHAAAQQVTRGPIPRVNSSRVHADPVYRLLEPQAWETRVCSAYPRNQAPSQNGRIGYHFGTGKHDVTEYDWEQYLDFADRHQSHELHRPGDRAMKQQRIRDSQLESPDDAQPSTLK